MEKKVSEALNPPRLNSKSKNNVIIQNKAKNSLSYKLGKESKITEEEKQKKCTLIKAASSLRSALTCTFND